MTTASGLVASLFVTKESRLQGRKSTDFVRFGAVSRGLSPGRCRHARVRDYRQRGGNTGAGGGSQGGRVMNDVGIGQPQWHHDCQQCAFLGRYGGFDLYHCPQGGRPTVVARFGNHNEEFLSGLPARPQALREAQRRSEDRGLLKPPRRSAAIALRGRRPLGRFSRRPRGPLRGDLHRSGSNDVSGSRARVCRGIPDAPGPCAVSNPSPPGVLGGLRRELQESARSKIVGGQRVLRRRPLRPETSEARQIRAGFDLGMG